MAAAQKYTDLELRLVGHTITAGRHRPLCNKACGFKLSDAEGAAKSVPNMITNEAYKHVKTSDSKACICSRNKLFDNAAFSS